MSPGKDATLTEKAVAAMRAAVTAVVEDHRRRGRPLAVWRNGKVVMEMPAAAEGVGEHRGDYHAGQQPGQAGDDDIGQNGRDED